MARATRARRRHLQDEVDFFSDVARGSLPQVSFIKPLGPDNEHPGYASLLQGADACLEYRGGSAGQSGAMGAYGDPRDL